MLLIIWKSSVGDLPKYTNMFMSVHIKYAKRSFSLLSCQAGVTCEAINVTKASKQPDKTSYSYDEEITYSCETGYEHTAGDLTRTCAAINKWSGALPVCKSRLSFVRNIVAVFFCIFLL